MDRTLLVDELRRGQVQRALEVNVQAGGKGLNVARAVRRLGESVRVVGFAGGLVGAFLRSEMRRLGIDDQMTETERETRTCYIFAEPTGGVSTVVNEPGPRITDRELAAFVSTYVEALADAQLVVFSGSLPPGTPADLYNGLLELAHSKGVRAILDTSGPALQAGLKGRPWAIKPNAEEFDQLMGTAQDLKANCAALVRQGVGNVVVTLGEEGAVVCSNGHYWRVTPPPITAVNPVGSGDAFVAGLAVSAWRGEPFEEGVRLGTSCAAANAANLAPDIPVRADLERYLQGVTMSEW